MVAVVRGRMPALWPTEGSVLGWAGSRGFVWSPPTRLSEALRKYWAPGWGPHMFLRPETLWARF